jgi:hypothetical protein
MMDLVSASIARHLTLEIFAKAAAAHEDFKLAAKDLEIIISPPEASMGSDLDHLSMPQTAGPLQRRQLTR